MSSTGVLREAVAGAAPIRVAAPLGMVLVPGGTFLLGSEASPDEGPRRRVVLSPFWMDSYPVTNRDFGAFLAAGAYTDPTLWSPAGWRFVHGRGVTEPAYWHDPDWNAPDMPVTGVSFYEAEAYARFMGKRLPTEAEWEFAAAGPEGRLYPWGDTAPDASLALFAPGCDPADLKRRGAPVGAFPVNVSPFGCVQMAGNLFEWCRDTWHPDHGWPAPERDPCRAGPPEAPRVVRGGSGLHDETFLRCTARDAYPPTVRDNIVGLRCVVPADAEPA